jgi:hypothetical protein
MWLKLHPSEGLEDWARRSKLLLEKRGEREQLELEWVERPKQIKRDRWKWAEQADRIMRLERDWDRDPHWEQLKFERGREWKQKQQEQLEL